MKHTLKIALLLVLIPGLLAAQEKRGPKGGAPIGSLYKTMGAPFSTCIDINNVMIWTKAEGWHPNVHLGYSSGVFPKNTFTMGYAQGWLFGGQVNDGASPLVRVGGGLDRPGMHAGKILPITGGGPVTGYEDPALPNVRIWRVRPDWATADLRDDAAQFFDKGLAGVTQGDIDALRAQYQTDWNEWPADKGAPFQYGAGRSAPSPYDPTLDIPGIPGAGQTVWTVANDLDPGLASSFYGSPPTGIEFQLTLWAYASSTPLNNCVFYRAKYIYRGTETTPPGSFIDSMFVTYWIDTDIGDYTDDYVGCDTTLNLGYGYNSKAVDSYYAAVGLPPPADGTVFLQGVATFTGNPNDSAIVNLQMRHGWKYVNSRPMAGFGRGSSGVVEPDYPGGGYQGSLQWYNQMRGFLPKPPYPVGNPLLNPTTGQATRYAVSGDPVTHTGWIDGSDFQAGDRRYNLTSGPFRMNLGDTAEVVSSFVGGMGADNLSSITVMKYNATFAQFAYNNLFVLPSPPPPPNVTVAELDKQIVLYWGADSARVAQDEQVVTKGFTFEGYNVYQFPTTNADLSTATRLATYDVVNNVTVIVDKAIDPQTGVIVDKPVEFGKNSGVKRLIDLTRDALLDKPLVNGQYFYYGVTAYSYNGDPSVPFHALESGPVLIQGRPQSSKPGLRYQAAFGDTISATHSAGSADAAALVKVVDPKSVTGHNYEIRVSVTDSVFNVDANRNFPNPKWQIFDLVKNAAVLSGQTDYNFDPANPIADGLQVGISGSPFWVPGKELASETYTPAADFNWSGVSRGGQFDGGGLFCGNGWFGGTLGPWDAAVSVQMEFNSTNGQSAYDFKRIVGGTSGGSPYAGFYPQPFKMYQLMPDGTKRQIDFAFMERDDSPAFENNLWAPPADAGQGEYFWIIGQDYTAAAKSEYVGSTVSSLISTKPVYWGGQYILTDATKPAYKDGDVWTLNAPKLVTSADRFAFTAPSIASSKDFAMSDVHLINVFPNPYYGFNAKELNRLEKYVTFSHLPAHAKIRIYTLGAALVKTIEKNDDTQFTNWNLRNQNNLPVASGIYIVHIELPDIGASKILKLAVVQEDEFLPIY